MKKTSIIIALFSVCQVNAQNLERAVEDYIRRNKVVEVSANDTTFYKTGKPYIMKYPSGAKTLTVPKGTFRIPMPIGKNDTWGKFYTPYLTSDKELTLYFVHMINGKEKVDAVKGADIMKGNRGRVDLLVEYVDPKKASIYCYFLDGSIFGSPFVMSKDGVAKLYSFKMTDKILNKEIPAMLIYEEKGNSMEKETIIKNKVGQYLPLAQRQYKEICKQLGHYCIVYYKLTEKHGKK